MLQGHVSSILWLTPSSYMFVNQHIAFFKTIVTVITIVIVLTSNVAYGH